MSDLGSGRFHSSNKKDRRYFGGASGVYAVFFLAFMLALLIMSIGAKSMTDFEQSICKSTTETMREELKNSIEGSKEIPSRSENYAATLPSIFNRSHMGLGKSWIVYGSGDM